MPPFITLREAALPVESPEALFRELRPRDGNVRHLWAHQADLLRSYHALDAADVAVELPTGAGKTLVGLLLAEFRRRARGERVAHLCPNVQLAKQAAARAADYGINAVALVGRQADYDVADFTAFQRGQKVAITTYNGVFNIRPRIEAQALVLDDAHAAEGPVANHWSVEAPRGGGLYDAVLAALIDGLTAPFREAMRDGALDPTRRYDVELVPPLFVARQAELLREALAVHAAAYNDHNRHAGRVIAEQIGHCLVYISWAEILVRPLVPPTSAWEAVLASDRELRAARVDGRSERSWRRRVASESPLLAARSNSFAWWRSWSRFGFGGRVGMTSPWWPAVRVPGLEGERHDPVLHSREVDSVLPADPAAPSRAYPETTATDGIARSQRLVVRRPSGTTTVEPSCKRIRILRPSGRTLTRLCGIGPAAPQGLAAGGIWKVAL
jgi:hypothetical protein